MNEMMKPLIPFRIGVRFKRAIRGFALLLCFLPSGLYALDLTARPDNFFVTPGTLAALNVLRNDDPGDCTVSALKVTIISPPSHAMQVAVNAAGQIRYRAVAGYTGSDELIYQIECNGVVSTAKAYIHVNNIPDNITPDVCHIPPPPQSWGISPSNTNERNLSPYQCALVGDLDNDGIREIVICADPVEGTVNGINRPAQKIAIYKGNNLAAAPKVITTVKPYRWNQRTKYGIVKTKISGKDSVLIVVAESDRYLRAYNYNGGLVWTGNAVYHNTVVDGISPGFADFNRDGIPEIMMCGKLFNSVNGRLLCAAPDYWGVPIAADLFGSGKLNLICGNSIYEPNASLTTLTLIRTITPSMSSLDPDKPSGTLPVPPEDGLVSVVDIDNDGKLELITQTRRGGLAEPYVGESFINVIDPSTGVVKASKYIPYAPMSSYPFVGDIDGDGYPEIVFITSRRNINPSTAAEFPYWIMHAFKYVQGNPVLQRFWKYEHRDASGGTMMTIFDFNQDGIAEIVYRDETNIRIINGSLKSHVTGLPVSAPYNLASFPNTSGTSAEYPTVADVDGDGQAEIMIVGGYPGTEPARGTLGPLWVYKSSNPSTSPWAPARKVWNQYAYNPVVVNEDLTVPVYPISPAAAFHEADGVTVNRPYNNFLQQGTDLNDEGDMLYLGPDLEFSPDFVPGMLYDAVNNRLEITIKVHNAVSEKAGAAFIGPLTIDTYVYNRAADTYTTMGSTVENISFAVDESKTITYFVNNFSSLGFPAGYDNWVIVLNGNNNAPGEPTFYEGAVECNWWNNFNTNISFSRAERVICEGNTETVTVEPSGVYRCEWYDAAVGGNHVNTGDSYNVTKNANPTQHYFVDIYTVSNGIKLNGVRDTVFVWLTPDSLVWTGGANTADWHNYNNWKNPEDRTGEYSRANIPRKCTDVLIPDMLDIYPDLDTPTNYARYTESECANIWFEHGGEVKQNNVLDYDSAYVFLTLETDRWNMVAVPLQYHYPGDYYLTDPNPFNDNLFVYTRFFGQTNPETGKYIEGDWTGEFNNPEIAMPAGSGLSAWLWDRSTTAAVTDTMLFPKHDLYYGMYDREGNITEASRPTPRTRGLGAGDHEHRFIYEPIVDSFGEFPLEVSAAGPNKMVLAGNPFMSHLDFNAFYTLNGPSGTNRIRNYYQVLDETGNYISYNATTGVSTGTPPLSRYIAPLQSFLVESRVAFSQLFADVYMMRSVPGGKLRSTQAETNPMLSIEITDASTGQQNKTILILNPDSEPGYDDTDVPKILPALMKNGVRQPIPASVFTRSTDGVALDVNQIPNKNEDMLIPVGIRSDKSGMYHMKITLLTGFPSDYDMSLLDTGNGMLSTEYSLGSDLSLIFDKATADELSDNRFYLSFRKTTAGIETLKSTVPGIEAYITNNVLRVYTTDGSRLEEVSLYDLQGHQIAVDGNIGGPEYRANVQGNRVYVVRARSGSTSRSIKVCGKY